MTAGIFLAVLVTSYLIGSIPFGYLLVRLQTGKDVRGVQSGRTGGTNAMRAAGIWIGLATGVLDVLKGASGVWLAGWLLPDTIWLKIFAPLAVIIGHNYSIFLVERKAGEIRFGGGAGGAPCIGGSFGLWPPSVLLLLPAAVFLLLVLGYASVATMSFALLSAALFSVMAVFYGFPWQYILFGVLAEVLLVWSLRPNIKRLMNGTERMVGWRAKKAQADRR